MLGGQQWVQHTVHDGGHDGVRLHHRQESPRPRVADAAKAQMEKEKRGSVIETKKLRREVEGERGTHYSEIKCREQVS